MTAYVNAFAGRDGRSNFGLMSAETLPRRLTSKLDTMARLTLEATQRFDEFVSCPDERIGLCIANRAGGWGFGEPEMQRLHETKWAAHVNVFLGTAWFPAASQGEVSIAHNFLGHSKTFCGDGVAFIEAFDYAIRLICNDVLDQVIVGAVEAVSSPWVHGKLKLPLREAVSAFLIGKQPTPAQFGRRVTVSVDADNVRYGNRKKLLYPVDAAMATTRALSRAITKHSSSRLVIADAREARVLEILVE